jgi:hypothetical protein
MCVEKRMLDLTIGKPKPLLLKKEKPKRENQSDPRTTEIVKELEKQYQDTLVAKEFKSREIRYRDALDTIPTVNYYPDSIHKCVESGETNVFELSKAQLSPRRKAGDKGFNVPTFLEGELNTHNIGGSSRSKGSLAKADDVNASTSFASLAAASINTGPYSEAFKVPPPKSLYKPRSESTTGFDGSDSLLADLDFQYLDERLLNQSPPAINDNNTSASDGSTNEIKNVSDVEKSMQMAEVEENGMKIIQ